MPEWFRAFFDETFADAFLAAPDPEKAAAEARIVQERLGLRPGHRVLDVPCGNGRLTLPMAQAGLVMTGIDLAEDYIERARRDAEREGLDVRYLVADMRRLDFDGEFDAAFNWGGSFGYFDADEDRLAAERLLAAARPGGRVLVEADNGPWVRAHAELERNLVVGGYRVLQSGRIDEATGRLHSTWTYLRGGETRRRELSLRLYDAEELAALLTAAGCCDVHAFGLYPETEPATAESSRLVAIGRRSTEGSA